MADRFHVPGEWSDFVELEGTEAHHLSRVLRAAPGDQIEIFDGHGHSSAAVVETVRKHSVTVRVIPPIKTTPPPNCEIVLAVAVPKGERLSWLIEKVTELGVDRLIPISTTRSVVKPSDQKLHKGEQTVIAACKQCGRDRALVIDDLCPLTDLDRRVNLKTARVLVGSPGVQVNTTDSLQEDYSRSAVLAVIGPEGGLTSEEEMHLKDRGARPISLSPHILRIETAAIAFATWLCAGRMHKERRDS